MRWPRTVFIGCMTLLVVNGSLSAQERGGFWFGFGLGSGWAHVSCEICEASRDLGISGNFKFGVTASPALLVGGEVNGWTQSDENVNELLAVISAVAYWYPGSGGHLQLKGGLGVVKYRIWDDERVITSTAFGPEIGISYDIGIARRVSLAPYLQATVTPGSAELRSEGTRVVGGASLSLLQLGLALTWH